MSEKTLAGQIDQEVTGLNSSQTRKPFTEPKLTFIEPKLINEGEKR